MNAADTGADFAAAERHCHLLVVNRQSCKAMRSECRAESRRISVGVRNPDQRTPKVFLPAISDGRLLSVRLTFGLGPADERCGVRSGHRPAAHHALAVVRFEAGLAIGSGQKAIGNRVSVGAQELRSRHIRDGRVRKLSLKSIDDGNNMRRLAGIVADQRPGLVSERAYDGNLFDPRFQRKQCRRS